MKPRTVGVASRPSAVASHGLCVYACVFLPCRGHDERGVFVSDQVALVLGVVDCDLEESLASSERNLKQGLSMLSDSCGRGGGI